MLDNAEVIAEEFYSKIQISHLELDTEGNLTGDKFCKNVVEKFHNILDQIVEKLKKSNENKKENKGIFS